MNNEKSLNSTCSIEWKRNCENEMSCIVKVNNVDLRLELMLINVDQEEAEHFSKSFNTISPGWNFWNGEKFSASYEDFDSSDQLQSFIAEHINKMLTVLKEG